MEISSTGPIAHRRFTLDKKCHSNINHKHNYDHTTIVINGRIEITVEKEDGSESKKEFIAGELFEVPAEQSHTIKALEDNSVYLCVFSHRDFKGLVTQKYIGNNGAYI